MVCRLLNKVLTINCLLIVKERAHHGHDHRHCVGAEPGQGLTRHLSDGGGEEEDGDQHHHHADREHGDVQAGDDVPVPDTADVQ